MVVFFRFPPAAYQQKRIDGMAAFGPLVSDENAEGLKAAIIVLFMEGREESKSCKQSLLQTRPGLADCFCLF